MMVMCCGNLQARAANVESDGTAKNSPKNSLRAKNAGFDGGLFEAGSIEMGYEREDFELGGGYRDGSGSRCRSGGAAEYSFLHCG